MSSIKSTKNITVDAVILAYKRPKYLRNVIAGVRRQACVRDIYIFHNAPSRKTIHGKGIINILSEKNFGCIPRHAVALLTDADYVLFVDDDTELCVDFSKRFVAAIKEHPKSIIGLLGRDIADEYASQDLYGGGGWYDESVSERYVDIIAGRVLLCKREWFQYLFALPFYQDYFDEDIMLNCAVQSKFNVPSVMVSSSSNEYIDLTTSHGANLRDNYLAQRSTVVRKCIDAGWRSYRYKRRVQQCNRRAERLQYAKEKKEKALVEAFNSAMHSMDIAEAVRGAEELVLLDCKNIRFLYNAASGYYNEQNLRKAKAVYKQVTREASSGDGEIIGLAFFKLALIARMEKKGKAFQQFLEKTMKYYPQHKRARHMLRKLKIAS